MAGAGRIETSLSRLPSTACGGRVLRHPQVILQVQASVNHSWGAGQQLAWGRTMGGPELALVPIGT